MHLIKTTLLLVLLSLFLLFVGSLVGGRQGLTFAFFLVLIMNFGSYWMSDKIVLSMHRAQPIMKKDAPEIFQMTEEMASQANIPMPSLYFIPTASPNAFATGRDYRHGTIVLTQGLVSLLSEEELRGVIAHEMGHIIHRDTLTATIVATLAGVISYMGMMMRWSSLFGGYRSGSRQVHPIAMLLIAFLMPIAAGMVQFAISRTREYAADDKGAELCGNPHFLASALDRISKGARENPLHSANPASAHLFIVNPLFGEMSFSNLFSTHPPIEKRIARLEEMGRR